MTIWEQQQCSRLKHFEQQSSLVWHLSEPGSLWNSNVTSLLVPRPVRLVLTSMLAVAMLPGELGLLSGLAPVWSPGRSGPRQEKTFFVSSRKTRDRMPHHNIQRVVAAKYPQRKFSFFIDTPHMWLGGWSGSGSQDINLTAWRKVFTENGLYFMDKVAPLKGLIICRETTNTVRIISTLLTSGWAGLNPAWSVAALKTT